MAGSSKVDLIKGDCLSLMGALDGSSVDLVLADLPYGITGNSWDTVIDLDRLWAQYWRVLKPSGAVCLTASQPFASALVMSQVEYFRHEWVWIKNRGSNFLNTVREPMKEHEHVLVFSKGGWTYNKQMQERTGTGSGRAKYSVIGSATRQQTLFDIEPLPPKTSTNYDPDLDTTRAPLSVLRGPSSWQKFNTDTTGLHPTIKPLPLFEYLVRTYTNTGDTVLDNAMGSGTTAAACINLGRNFVGMELDPEYYEIAVTRITNIAKEIKL